MATFVLVGGAWMGGWVWQPVARRLRAKGHEVYPATLTGLGERAHLAQPEIDLDTHITDVVNLIRHEDLADVVLVGHSYAAIVVTGVADRIPERLAHLVFLDSAPADDGEAFLDYNSPDGQEQLRREVAEQGDGWRLPFPPFEELGQQADLEGLGDAERRLMEAKAVAQPFGTYQQPLRLTRGLVDDYRRTIVACNEMMALFAAGIPRFQALAAPPWQIRDLPTGHWPMLSQPDELAALLDDLAANG